MPLPLAALVPPLVAWGSRTLAAYGLARLFSDEPVQELKRIILGWVVEVAAERAGLQLDPADPFSDSSMAGAVSLRTGVPIRSLRDKQMVVEDMENYALGLVSARSGYTIRSLTDREILRQDVQRIGAAILSEKVGLPLGIIGEGEIDPATVKENLLAWAKAELLTRVEGEARLAVGDLIAAGGLEAVAQEVNSKLSLVGSVENVTARQLAVKVSEMMAAAAVADFGKVAKTMSKRSRKQELGRAAQAKFRARHGNRQQYVPLGMSANIG